MRAVDRAARSSIGSFGAVLSVLVMVLALAPAASAAPKKVDRFFPANGALGGLGGQFNTPRGIAINQPSPADAKDGWIYVADDLNHRIQAFNAAGVFQWAIGRNVSISQTTGDDSGAVGYAAEKCTAASDCQGGNVNAAVGGFTGVRGGMFDNGQGIAIDQTTGDFYVRDRDNRRIQRFTADGTFISAWGWDVTTNGSPSDPANITGYQICTVAADCKIGLSGGNGGQFNLSSTSGAGIVVDPAAPHHVFVADGSNRRVQQFEPDGDFVRTWGWDVTTGAPVEFEFCASTTVGICKGGANSTPINENGAFASGNPTSIAIDGASGYIYAADSALNNRVLRFDSDEATPADLLKTSIDVVGLTSTASVATTALEVHPGTGNLFVARGAIPIPFQDAAIHELGNPSAAVPTHADTHVGNAGLAANGLAVDATSGDLYLTSNSTVGSTAQHRVYVADDDGASGALDVTLNPPTGVTAHEASFSGTVNPDGFPVTYQFQVSKTGVAWTAVAAPVSLGDGVVPVAVPVSPAEGQAVGLEACTPYRFRVLAIRGFNNGSVESAELSFITDCVAPETTTGEVISRDAGSAYLTGTINPNGTATTYWFEYGLTAAYGTEAPVPAASAGAGGVSQAVTQQVGDLQPDRVYHYRLCATNAHGTDCGDDETFATLPTPSGGDAARGYERVSPASTGGVGVGPWYTGIGAATWAGTAAYEKERFAVKGAYGSMIADGGMAWAHDYALAERTPNGWVSRPAMTLPNTGDASYRMLNMRSASSDLGTFTVNSNAGVLRMFPEMADWDTSTLTVGDPTFIGSWDSRWEIFAPTAEAQVDTTIEPLISQRKAETVVSADGASVVGFGPYRGVLGVSDPSNDSVAGRPVYLDDISSGLSNEFPGDGQRLLVNACTDGTLLPERLVSGLLEDRPCPAPLPNRSAGLVSPRGAALHASAETAEGGPVSSGMKNIVSENGSRVFFMSPDPGRGAAPNVGCTGTGGGTSCPPQLYVRQRNEDGSIVTRWVSRAAADVFGTQSADLMGPVIFEGATPAGDVVYFRTNSPLTADDPNGGASGAPSNNSWDLYRYELPGGSDGDPATADGDPAGGTLTRISRGPTGTADPNGLQDGSLGVALLRFAAADGKRAYFATSAALPGVPASDNGGITSPSGTPTSSDAVNLYLYENVDGEESWEFVARLPRAVNQALSVCASTGAYERAPLWELSPLSGIVNLTGALTQSNCMRGTDDGALLTFWTDGRLTADDPDTSSGDVYAYDAESQVLTRISRPQGGSGGSYECAGADGAGPALTCFGDVGSTVAGREALPMLGVVTRPADGDRIAFFQSGSQLVPEDSDDAYDVYQWRNGELSLITSGASTTDGAFYKGNSADGRNVYFATRDRYTWQDVDATLDVYTARIGGGIPEPVAPSICAVVVGSCQGGADSALDASVRSTAPGGGDATLRSRATLSLAAIGSRARAAAARRGVLELRVRSTVAGRVRVTVRSGKGVVGRKAVRASANRAATARVSLASSVRRRLAEGRSVRLSVVVAQQGARSRTISVLLRRAVR